MTDKRIDDDESVRAAKAKADATDSYGKPARTVELEAARLLAENPAMSTAEATAKAKEIVGDPDPFNTNGLRTEDNIHLKGGR